MRDFIVPPQKRVNQAWLVQQRPSALICAVESEELYSVYPQVWGFSRGSLSAPSTCGTASTTRTRVLGLPGSGNRLGESHITGGPAACGHPIVSTTESEWTAPEPTAWAHWVEITKELLQRQNPEPKPISLSAAAKLRVDRLTYIQAVFGLTMQAMADILGVTRQGLYKWLDATKDITLQEASRHRLIVVERLVERWRERSSAPLASLVSIPLASGSTVLDMFKGVLDENAITDAFDELAAMLLAKPKTLSQRMANSGFKRRPSVRSLPPDE